MQACAEAYLFICVCAHWFSCAPAGVLRAPQDMAGSIQADRQNLRVEELDVLFQVGVDRGGWKEWGAEVDAGGRVQGCRERRWSCGACGGNAAP